MSKVVNINQQVVQSEKNLDSTEGMSDPSPKEKHLEGFSESEKKMIRMIANIFVKIVLKNG